MIFWLGAGTGILISVFAILVTLYVMSTKEKENYTVLLVEIPKESRLELEKTMKYCNVKDMTYLVECAIKAYSYMLVEQRCFGAKTWLLYSDSQDNVTHAQEVRFK